MGDRTKAAPSIGCCSASTSRRSTMTEAGNAMVNQGVKATAPRTRDWRTVIGSSALRVCIW